MTTLKIIIHELSTAPESLLQDVNSLIKSAKVDAAVSDRLPHTSGLHQVKVWMSDDFNDSLFQKLSSIGRQSLNP
jgi:hypothetical protein